MVAPSATLWKLSMDPLLGGMVSPQPAIALRWWNDTLSLLCVHANTWNYCSPQLCKCYHYNNYYVHVRTLYFTCMWCERMSIYLWCIHACKFKWPPWTVHISIIVQKEIGRPCFYIARYYPKHNLTYVLGRPLLSRSLMHAELAVCPCS